MCRPFPARPPTFLFLFTAPLCVRTRRLLQCAYLRFSPAERSFYDHILDKTAAAKQEMEAEAAAAAAAAAAAVGAGGSAAAAAAAAGSGGGRRGRGRGRGKGGKGSKGPQDLQQLAADQIAQLRRACVHPQLTRYGRGRVPEPRVGQNGWCMHVGGVCVTRG